MEAVKIMRRRLVAQYEKRLCRRPRIVKRYTSVGSNRSTDICCMRGMLSCTLHSLDYIFPESIFIATNTTNYVNIMSNVYSACTQQQYSKELYKTSGKKQQRGRK